MDSNATLTSTSLAQVLLKVLALYLILLGLWDLLVNLLNSYQSFDPSYILYFLKAQVLSPSIGIAFGIILWFTSPALAQRITR